MAKIKNYRGRFAPTPSGMLHFGSVVAALGSYLDAKSNKGKWFIRIDDIDQSRNKLGANEIILKQIEDLGLKWDEPIIYQSQRIDLYETALQRLKELNHTFQCACSRKKVKNQIYPGTCRNKKNTSEQKYSIRIKSEDTQISIIDRLQGWYAQNIKSEIGDFIIKRSDGYFAYHLATVVDDSEQRITNIVRGFDLLDSTVRQVFLQNKLKFNVPEYLHLPIAVDSSGKKISKANNEIAHHVSSSKIILVNALRFLGHYPPDDIENSDVEIILEWGIDNWNINVIPKKAKIRHEIEAKI